MAVAPFSQDIDKKGLLSFCRRSICEAARRAADRACEGGAECARRLVANRKTYLFDPSRTGLQRLLGKRHAPVQQVGDRADADDRAEARGKRRP